MAKYRKKPVVIEAVLFDGSSQSAERICQAYPSDVSPEFEDVPIGDTWTGRLQIATLEGAMIANPGDWIITGVQGERYPCKPDIFHKTYEPADSEE